MGNFDVLFPRGCGKLELLMRKGTRRLGKPQEAMLAKLSMYQVSSTLLITHVAQKLQINVSIICSKTRLCF